MASVTGQLLVVLRHADVIVDTCRTRVYTHTHPHALSTNILIMKQAYVACVVVVATVVVWSQS